MRRRDFLKVTANTLAIGFLASCGLARQDAIGPFSRLTAAAFHRERRFTRTRHGNIAYVARGSGPAALFLHGFPLNGFQWRGAIERLSPYRRCFAPDFLGLGYTEPFPGASYAPESQVAMLVEFLDAHAIDKTDVVANDSGGQAAQILVARNPERVRSLILTNCDAENDSPPQALAPVVELAKRGEFVDQWLGAWRSDTTLARSSQGIGGMVYSDPVHPTDEAIEMYFGPLLDVPGRKEQTHAYAIALERNPLVGIGPALKRFKGPVRIVWGTEDNIFSSASPEFLNKAFGNSKGVRKLEGRKLFWPEEIPGIITSEAVSLWNVDA